MAGALGVPSVASLQASTTWHSWSLAPTCCSSQPRCSCAGRGGARAGGHASQGAHTCLLHRVKPASPRPTFGLPEPSSRCTRQMCASILCAAGGRRERRERRAGAGRGVRHGRPGGSGGGTGPRGRLVACRPMLQPGSAARLGDGAGRGGGAPGVGLVGQGKGVGVVVDGAAPAPERVLRRPVQHPRLVGGGHAAGVGALDHCLAARHELVVHRQHPEDAGVQVPGAARRAGGAARGGWWAGRREAWGRCGPARRRRGGPRPALR